MNRFFSCNSGLWRLCLAGFLLLLGHAAKAGDTNAALESWFAAQANLHTWTAEFVQTRTLKTLSHPLTADGKIWFAAPDIFRWGVGIPPQTIALRQTNEFLILYPRLKRVERYPMEGKDSGQWRDALAILDAGFPRNRTELESQFRLLSVVDTPEGFRLSLEPKSAKARRFMTQIELGFRTSQFSLVSTEVKFIDGSSMRNDFTNMEMNSPIPSGIFELKIGPEIKVVESMGK